SDGDIVWINDRSSPIDSPPGPTGTLYRAERYADPEIKEGWSWRFHLHDPSPSGSPLEVIELHHNLTFDPDPQYSDQVRIVTLTVTVTQVDGTSLVWDSLAPDPKHVRAGLPDSMMALFAAKPSNLAQARSIPIVITANSNLTGLEILHAIFPRSIIDLLNDPT